MVSKLEALKKKKAMLLKKAGMSSANIASLKQRAAEERKLKAEIFALEHPESARARDTFKSASKKLGGFIKRNSANFARNAERMGKQMREEAKKNRAEERKVEIARLKAVKRVGGKKKVVRKVKRVAKRVRKRKGKAIDYGW